jgi:hypothetical protein
MQSVTLNTPSAKYTHNNQTLFRTPLTTLTIGYVDFAGENQIGRLCVHPEMAPATEAFFAELHVRRFPIFSMMPWEEAGEHARQFRLCNTVAYLTKMRQGKKSPSHHAYGLAFDLNPQLNPFIWPERNLLVPPFATYNPGAPGTVTEEIAELAESHGFLWGGRWQEKKDYMHFSLADCESLIPSLQPELPGSTFI